MCQVNRLLGRSSHSERGSEQQKQDELDEHRSPERLGELRQLTVARLQGVLWESTETIYRKVGWCGIVRLIVN